MDNRPDGADAIGTIELELVKLVRQLETFGRRSSLYVRVDRAGYLAMRVLEDLGPVSTNALAQALHLDASTVTRQIAPLERGGLIERRPDPADGRSSSIALTAEGRRCMIDVTQERRRRIEEQPSWVAEVDGEVVAVARWTMSFGSWVEVGGVATHPEFRRRFAKLQSLMMSAKRSDPLLQFDGQRAFQFAGLAARGNSALECAVREGRIGYEEIATGVMWWFEAGDLIHVPKGVCVWCRVPGPARTLAIKLPSSDEKVICRNCARTCNRRQEPYQQP